MRETRFSFVFVPFHAWMACEPTRSTYIHVHVSLCRPWKHHTDAFSITFLGVMGEASVVCGCGCVGGIHMYQSSVGTFCFGRGAATVSRCLSYGILGIDSCPGIQPHIWLIYIWRMRKQLIPGRFSAAFNRPENKAMSALVLHVHCNTTAHSLHT